MTFKKGIDPKESLDIGQTKYYKDLWYKKKDLIDEVLSEFAREIFPGYYFGELEHRTGLFHFYNEKIRNYTDHSSARKASLIGIIPLEILIERLKEYKEKLLLQQQLKNHMMKEYQERERERIEEDFKREILKRDAEIEFLKREKIKLK